MHIYNITSASVTQNTIILEIMLGTYILPCFVHHIDDINVEVEIKLPTCPNFAKTCSKVVLAGSSLWKDSNRCKQGRMSLK